MIGILIVVVLVLLYQVHELRTSLMIARTDCTAVQNALQYKDREYSDLQTALAESPPGPDLERAFQPQPQPQPHVAPAPEDTSGASRTFESPASVDYPTPRHGVTYPEDTPRITGSILPANQGDAGSFGAPF